MDVIVIHVSFIGCISTYKMYKKINFSAQPHLLFRLRIVNLTLYASHFIYAGTSDYCVAIDTKHRDVPAYTKCDLQLIKLLLMMD
jgi:hypothetical protein